MLKRFICLLVFVMILVGAFGTVFCLDDDEIVSEMVTTTIFSENFDAGDFSSAEANKSFGKLWLLQVNGVQSVSVEDGAMKIVPGSTAGKFEFFLNYNNGEKKEDAGFGRQDRYAILKEGTFIIETDYKFTRAMEQVTVPVQAVTWGNKSQVLYQIKRGKIDNGGSTQYGEYAVGKWFTIRVTLNLSPSGSKFDIDLVCEGVTQRIAEDISADIFNNDPIKQIKMWSNTPASCTETAPIYVDNMNVKTVKDRYSHILEDYDAYNIGDDIKKSGVWNAGTANASNTISSNPDGEGNALKISVNSVPGATSWSENMDVFVNFDVGDVVLESDLYIPENLGDRFELKEEIYSNNTMVEVYKIKDKIYNNGKVIADYPTNTWFKLRVIVRHDQKGYNVEMVTSGNVATIARNIALPGNFSANFDRQGLRNVRTALSYLSGEGNPCVVYKDNVKIYDRMRLSPAEPVISGVGLFNQTLTADYTYKNDYGYADAGAVFSWMRSDMEDAGYVEIPGVSGNMYTITEEDIGKFIKVIVFTKDENGLEGKGMTSLKAIEVNLATAPEYDKTALVSGEPITALSQLCSPEDIKGTITLGVYDLEDNSDVLNAVAIETFSAAAGEVTPISVTISALPELTENSYIKVFVWDDEMRPIIKEGYRQMDLSFIAPEVQTYPDTLEYQDGNRLWQGIPGIERVEKNGRLWATWYSGSTTENEYNWAVLYTSENDGDTWSGPAVVIDPIYPVRAYDPVLWTDPNGRLWFFWNQSYYQFDGRCGVWAIYTDNPEDASPVWSSPERIANGIVMNKPIVLKNGDWMLPTAIWSQSKFAAMGDEINSNVYISKDGGETWTYHGSVKGYEGDRNCDENMVIEQNDGSLRMLIRTRAGIEESYSYDGGVTWTDSVNANISKVMSRFHIRRLASGNQLMIYNNPPENGTVRSHLTAAISYDDGKTWEDKLVLDERTGVAYPDAVQAEDGKIYIIYDRNRFTNMEILMAVITEEDIAAGELVSDGSRLRVMVNNNNQPIVPPVEIHLDEPATASFSAGTAGIISSDALIFNNRTHEFGSEVPVGLIGRDYLCADLGTISGTITEAGWVYVLTPASGTGTNSRQDDLAKDGFDLVAVIPRGIFATLKEDIAVMGKYFDIGESFSYNSWGVPIVKAVLNK